MSKVFCNDLQPNTHIRIKKESGESQDFIVRRMIPMQLERDGAMGEIADIEILLDKSKNIYFSYKMYLSGTSWAREIEILS